MFKRFSVAEHVSSQSKVKQSEQRRIRNAIIEQYPTLAEGMDELLPKKELVVAKCQNHLNLILSGASPLFFNVRDGPYFPTLRLLHQFPDMLPQMQIDAGGIRFIISGAHVMAPGLTSAGGKIADVAEGDVVAVMAEGKQHALAVGIANFGADAIREMKRGAAIDCVHCLNDDLWLIKEMEGQ